MKGRYVESEAVGDVWKVRLRWCVESEAVSGVESEAVSDVWRVRLEVMCGEWG